MNQFSVKSCFRRVLVTGGAGFIGHRVVNLLKQNGIDVAVLDNLSVGMPMPKSEKNVRCFLADIRHADEVERVFRNFRPDAVIHLAAVHHIPTCEEQRALSLAVNIVGTENVLRAAELTRVKCFIVASSGAVYDWVEGELKEDVTPLSAKDNYALCKLTNESQVKFWGEKTGEKVRIARIFNTIGHDDPNGHLIPDILSQIDFNQTEACIRLGNTSPLRDYIHANDTASAIVAILNDSRDDIQFDTFNICTGKEFTVLDIVSCLSEIVGININVATDSTRVRKIDRKQQLGSIEKIKGVTGWSPKRSLKESLNSIVSHLNVK